MIVKLQLKHIVIFLFVITITFSTVFIYPLVGETNSTINVSYLYSENNVSEESKEKLVWDSIIYTRDTLENLDDPIYIKTDYNRNTSAGDAAAKLDIYIDQSDVLVIQGNQYNSNLRNVIEDNKNKYFILIGNEEDYDSQNVSYINIDNQSIYDDVLGEMKNESNSKKFLFVSTTKEEDNIYFQNLEKSDQYSMSYYYIEDKSLNGEISQRINEEIDNGVDQIFVEEITLTNYISSLVYEKQNEINSNLKIYNETSAEISNINELLTDEELTEEEVADYNEQISTLESNIVTIENPLLTVYNIGFDKTTLFENVSDSTNVEEKQLNIIQEDSEADETLTEDTENSYDVLPGNVSYVIDISDLMYEQISSVLNQDFEGSTNNISITNNISKNRRKDEN